MRTARAKGLTERRVIIKHALRNALIPVVTMMGLQFGFLLGGSIVVETVFNWPGLGRAAVDAVTQRDYPVIQGLVLLFSLEFILINLIVDVLYGVINPSIRYKLRRPWQYDTRHYHRRRFPERRAHARHRVLAQIQEEAGRRRRHLRPAAGRGGDLRPWIVPFDAENFFDYDALNAGPR